MKCKICNEEGKMFYFNVCDTCMSAVGSLLHGHCFNLLKQIKQEHPEDFIEGGSGFKSMYLQEIEECVNLVIDGHN